MTLKQLSVFLENKPGALSRACRVLGDARINIQTFALADTEQFGILRLVVHEWEHSKELLEKSGFAVKVTEVLALEVPDRPGGLAAVLEAIERLGVNVEYMYAFTAKQDGKGLMLFRFDQPDLAMAKLQASQLTTIDTVELFARLASS